MPSEQITDFRSIDSSSSEIRCCAAENSVAGCERRYEHRRDHSAGRRASYVINKRTINTVPFIYCPSVRLNRNGRRAVQRCNLVAAVNEWLVAKSENQQDCFFFSKACCEARQRLVEGPRTDTNCCRRTSAVQQRRPIGLHLLQKSVCPKGGVPSGWREDAALTSSPASGRSL